MGRGVGVGPAERDYAMMADAMAMTNATTAVDADMTAVASLPTVVDSVVDVLFWDAA